MALTPINPKNFSDGSTPTGSEIIPVHQTVWRKLSLTVIKDWLAGFFASKSSEHSHANKSTLDSVSGTNTGDQDLSGYALTSHNHSGTYDPLGAASSAVSGHESSYAHADIDHSNRTALNAVSGTNTGDQDLSGLALSNHNHAGVYLSDPGDGYTLVTDDEKAAITHSNRSALDLVSGTNTGDQDLSGLALANHSHTGTYDPLGAASGAVATHEASFNHSVMISDAPNDGKYYVRRNGSWEELAIS